jgi:dipeptidyl aminopeptidase/acylaminoacyl peptidase
MCPVRAVSPARQGVQPSEVIVEGQPLSLETLLAIPYVQPDEWFDLSPSGAEVAFAYNLSGRWEIFLTTLDGSTPPRQVTAGPGGKFCPRWSPDGRYLAYVLDSDGSEEFDIWVCRLSTGDHFNLTPDTPDAILSDYAWSPDGSRIAFISNRSGCFDTYVMSVPCADSAVAASAPSLTLQREASVVFSLPFPDRSVRWSPDGRRLGIAAETTGQDWDTFVVSLEDGDSCRITQGGAPVHARQPCWSPDGKRVAFAADRGEYLDIGICEPGSDRIEWVTEGEGDKKTPAWSPDGRQLAYVVSHGPVMKLAVLDLVSKAQTIYEVAPGLHFQPQFTADGTHVVFLFDNPSHPCGLWVLSLNDGGLQQLTDALPPNIGEADFAVPHSIVYRSLNGREVPALLYRAPKPARGRPAVVYVHGGPDWLAEVTWRPLLQHMVDRGWTVLAPNYRGSTGYGRKWQLANRFDLGGGDTQDVVAGADYLVREGLADPSRIGVTGESYGGYLTMTSLTQYPRRWAVGSAVVPFLNWFTAFANERDDLQHWDSENFGSPDQDHSMFRERSPFFFLERISAPVQLICGANDPRCPASESIQARDALIALGKECALVLYEDEGHDFLKLESLVDSEQRRVDFLAKVLEKRGHE